MSSFWPGWDNRLDPQWLMPMPYLIYRLFLLEFSSVCDYIYLDFDSYKKKYKKHLNTMERESLFVASAEYVGEFLYRYS